MIYPSIHRVASTSNQGCFEIWRNAIVYALYFEQDKMSRMRLQGTNRSQPSLQHSHRLKEKESTEGPCLQRAKFRLLELSRIKKVDLGDFVHLSLVQKCKLQAACKTNWITLRATIPFLSFKSKYTLCSDKTPVAPSLLHFQVYYSQPSHCAG